MILEVQWAGFWRFAGDTTWGFAWKLEVVVDKDAVVVDGDSSVGRFLTLGVEFGSFENDVVGLPGERRVAHVQAGVGDLVDTAAFVVFTSQAEGVEDLQFVTAVNVHAAVASSLTTITRLERGLEFEVESVVLEAFFGAAADAEEFLVDDFTTFELICIGAIEEDFGTLGWFHAECFAFA